MCGIESAKAGRNTTIFEHNRMIGTKILISGGGRCNFTNKDATHLNYTTANPHFHKSAMSRYTPEDTIDLVEQYDIEYYEKTLGQLFCNKSSREITSMLESEAEKYGLEIKTRTKVLEVSKQENGRYKVRTDNGDYNCESLVIATGGLSFPSRGATDFSYKIAKQFELEFTEPKPGLVPLRLDITKNFDFRSLRGVSFFAEVFNEEISFREAVLFTHKGLSGPAILQISNYMNGRDKIYIKIEPYKNIPDFLSENRTSGSLVKNILSKKITARFAEEFCKFFELEKPMKSLSDIEYNRLIENLDNWEVTIIGDEGYSKAEITLGGVHPDELSSKTMETRKHKGLYIIGEAVDVNGWLGGYNFAWAWASGWAAGQYV
jgi:predicted Rossmann fold flavoprotein